ncbi:heat shock protein HslJ [Orbus hercynius]|uniref:Heat shock protein HslJ n=1 Tax=Orbus hercynius TaxID=593135 RepID=A0A495RJ02_9GAMM|nr:META domain-containing protein [Orbus hercynius]RKS87512.1 heat shock protein HslJ [Orbus hercynius]
MKKKLCFLLLTTSLMITACDKTKPVQAEDLMHHRFTVKTLNGQAMPNSPQTFIEFGEHLTINGQMCNRFFGQSILTNNELTSPGLAMTKRLCADEQLNQLDSVISELFKNGATVKLDNQTNDKVLLKLTDNSNTIVFELNDLM